MKDEEMQRNVHVCLERAGRGNRGRETWERWRERERKRERDREITRKRENERERERERNKKRDRERINAFS